MRVVTVGPLPEAWSLTWATLERISTDGLALLATVGQREAVLAWNRNLKPETGPVLLVLAHDHALQVGPLVRFGVTPCVRCLVEQAEPFGALRWCRGELASSPEPTHSRWLALEVEARAEQLLSAPASGMFWRLVPGQEEPPLPYRALRDPRCSDCSPRRFYPDEPLHAATIS